MRFSVVLGVQIRRQCPLKAPFHLQMTINTYDETNYLFLLSLADNDGTRLKLCGDYKIKLGSA